MELNPSFIEKNGVKQYVVLPYEEFTALQAILEDAEDLLELRKVKHEEERLPSLSLDDVKKQLGL